jgi:hypothetical protein
MKSFGMLNGLVVVWLLLRWKIHSQNFTFKVVCL